MPRSDYPQRSNDFELVVDEKTSKRLGRIRQKGTKPEIDMRAIASSLGLRYRVQNRDLPGAPDLANRSSHWAIFVHGCFWHAHKDCPKATVPKRNRLFWKAKLLENRRRDIRAASQLTERGFKVVTVWECELRSDPRQVRRAIETAISNREHFLKRTKRTSRRPRPVS